MIKTEASVEKEAFSTYRDPLAKETKALSTVPTSDFSLAFVK